LLHVYLWTCVGIARGGGFQQIGAYVNLGAYYLVGIPMGLFLGFHLQLNAQGLWMGPVSGSVLQVIILVIITSQTNWQKEVSFSFLTCINLCSFIFRLFACMECMLQIIVRHHLNR